jgi:hypothetical protein
MSLHSRRSYQTPRNGKVGNQDSPIISIAEEEIIENPSYAISRPFAKEGRR